MYHYRSLFLNLCYHIRDESIGFELRISVTGTDHSARNHSPLGWSIAVSVTSMGDLLDFGQLFKAFGKNLFVQISHIFSQFL